jgi:large subunit ribosomal protein L10
VPSKRNVELLESLKNTLAGAKGSFFLVDYQGLPSNGEQKLRRAFREKGAQMIVAKNTLIERALAELNLPKLDGLKGPSAVVLFSDPVAAAKAIAEFAKTNDKGLPAAKGGVLSGNVIGADDVKALASLPSQTELRAELVGVLQSAMSELVGVLGAKAQEFVGILDAFVAKQEAA